MSYPRDIDNDLAVSLTVHIEPSQSRTPSPTAPFNALNTPFSRDRPAQKLADEFSSLSDGNPSQNSVPGLDPAELASVESNIWAMMTPRDKGKSAARPVDIAARRSTSGVFSMSFQQEGAFPSDAGPSASTLTSPISVPIIHSNGTHDEGDVDAAIDNRLRIFRELVQEISPPNKGKEREPEPIPTLPPLSFSPSRLDPEDLYPTSLLTPGPSSFGSSFSDGASPPDVDLAGPSRRMDAPVAALSRMPSRRRSLSNLSIHSAHSVTARVKGKLGSASPARLVRRMFSKDDSIASTPASPLTSLEPHELEFDVGPAGCFTPWRCDTKLRATPAPPFPNMDLDRLLNGNTEPTAPYPLYRTAIPLTDPTMFKTKGRSNSDPFPMSSVFDVIAHDLSADVFVPLTTEEPPSSVFQKLLPRELQLHILSFIVQLHEEEHVLRVRNGEWTALKAAKHKWIGRDQGLRELARLGRVCKLWHSLVFDGQLWGTLNFRSFPRMPAASVLQAGRSAGPFITGLDLSGHGNLRASTLEHLTNSLSVYRGPFVGETRLTALNLSGCKALTTAALHYLLDRSPAIESLNLRGLLTVTNETCEVLARSCRNIITLNMSRCKSLSGAGFRFLLSGTLREGRVLPLKDLRLSGIKGVTDDVLEDLGRAAPDLEVLDLSYCRDLHNSSIGAFVACEDESDPATTVILTARQAGRDPSTGRRYRRRVTRLRHISLSCCMLLTDNACAHFAHAVPDLELLELAGIGSELKDEGLILLLSTTPKLRKLDLADAIDISDAILHTLTPRMDMQRSIDASPLVGRALEHLIISFAIHLTNEPLLALMHSCPRLRVVEADNTNISGNVAREFAALARARAMKDAVLIAVDCRSVSENVAKELAGTTRPRLGWRAHAARRLAYLDGADAESAGLGVGQDECDPARVVFKTFYGWQAVDAVTAARQRRKRGRREANRSDETTTSMGDADDAAGDSGGGRARWWAPGGRRAASAGSAAMLEIGNERDGCVVM